MILITLRDMQWRARRVLLGLAATALVLAMTSLLGALHDGFLRETDRTIDFFGADRWLVASQVAGPFTSNTPVRTSLLGEVERDSGVRDVTPVAIFRHVVRGIALKRETVPVERWIEELAAALSTHAGALAADHAALQRLLES